VFFEAENPHETRRAKARVVDQTAAIPPTTKFTYTLDDLIDDITTLFTSRLHQLLA